MEFAQRKPNRMENYDYSQNGAYFITICTANRAGIFAPTISRVVKQFKGAVTKQIGCAIWQKSFYDHTIRNQRDYDEIWEYIENNPRKWAMTK